jgi:phospholipase/lecithinase/hemolysin
MEIRLFLRGLPIVLALGCSPAVGGYSALYVFGDSNSDTGNYYALTGFPPSPPYANGRLSNGPMAVEFLAQGLGIGPADFHNYAVAGAFSGYGNIQSLPIVAATGMLNQYEHYVNTILAGGPADPDALYMLWGGANEFNKLFQDTQATGGASLAQIQAVSDVVIANYTTVITGLAMLGAENFLAVDKYGRYGNIFNPYFTQAMDALDSLLTESITVFNVGLLVTDMAVNPADYGFADHAPIFTNYCLADSACIGSPSVQRSYIVWDLGGHLTTAAQQFIGEAMVQAVVPEPSTRALMAVGFFLLVALARPRARKARKLGRTE